jgi:dynein heavy chain 1
MTSRLHEKFKEQYIQSKACKITPVSGSIIRAKQIDKQLTAFMRRLEDVFG